ncbi:MAG TPA: DNA polymerase IV [Terriglobales bacterium]|nr:DNA polymerase IV [Terriglobales bacterium]
MARVIFHIDLDAFYASVEQREHSNLRGLPLIIGADPKGGKGRGVVVACSYEARKKGLHSGQPISRAYKLCPEGVYVPPNFALYAQVSTDVMDRIKKYADKFEQMSIDEACMEVTRSCQNYGGPIPLAQRIKEDVKTNEGLSCSVGIAPNKSSAKIASDFQKPDGLTYIDPDHVKEFLAPLPVSKISGVGEKTEIALNQLGIKTIGDLAKYPPKALYRQFGKTSVWLWAIANAEEKVEVIENYVMKSIGAETTFDVDTEDWTAVDRQLDALEADVYKRLIESRMVYRTVSLKIRFTHFQTYTREKTIRFPTTDKETIHNIIQELTKEFRSNGKKVRLVGVRVSGLDEKAAGVQPKGTLDQFVAPT